jgi:hypothetical protein
MLHWHGRLLFLVVTARMAATELFIEPGHAVVHTIATNGALRRVWSLVFAVIRRLELALFVALDTCGEERSLPSDL